MRPHSTRKTTQLSSGLVQAPTTYPPRTHTACFSSLLSFALSHLETATHHHPRQCSTRSRFLQHLCCCMSCSQLRHSRARVHTFRGCTDRMHTHQKRNRKCAEKHMSRPKTSHTYTRTRAHIYERIHTCTQKCAGHETLHAHTHTQRKTKETYKEEHARISAKHASTHDTYRQDEHTSTPMISTLSSIFPYIHIGTMQERKQNNFCHKGTKRGQQEHQCNEPHRMGTCSQKPHTSLFRLSRPAHVNFNISKPTNRSSLPYIYLPLAID